MAFLFRFPGKVLIDSRLDAELGAKGTGQTGDAKLFPRIPCVGALSCGKLLTVGRFFTLSLRNCSW